MKLRIDENTQPISIESIIDNPTLEFEISEYNDDLDIMSFAAEVEKKYPDFKFNRTEERYDSCIMAIFEKR